MSKSEFNKRAKEIGSYFDISPNDIENSKVEDIFMPFGEAVYLSTCRSAIDLVLNECLDKNKVALLPGFTCHAVVEPFIKKGYEVIPYSITSDLKINIDDLEDKIENFQPSVILFHDYFGFDTNGCLRKSGFFNKVKKSGIKIINDQTQSMFSSYTRLVGDYYLGSIRKWMGIPDGAYLLGASKEYSIVYDEELEQAKVSAMIYKHDFLFKGEGTKEELLTKFRKAEVVLDSREKPYAISNITKALMNHYDIDELKWKRKINGQVLLESILKNDYLTSPFKNVKAEEVPFYIPIFVGKNRKAFQGYLAQNNVFATVIWGCPEEFVDRINDETQMIYDEILCIPCDQRYSVEDMKYICKLLNDYKWEE